VDAFLAGLRRAPMDTPAGPLTYGELVAAAKFNVPAFPADCPQTAAALELALEGDGTILKLLTEGLTSDAVRLAFEQNTALTCADAPSRQTAAQWPGVVHRLMRISRIGGTALGWVIGAPCASWPARSAALLDARLARSGVADMVVRLSSEPAPDLRELIAWALRDDSLTVAYWLPEYGSWAGADGEPVTLAGPGGERGVTVVEQRGEPLAALLYHPSLRRSRSWSPRWARRPRSRWRMAACRPSCGRGCRTCAGHGPGCWSQRRRSAAGWSLHVAREIGSVFVPPYSFCQARWMSCSFQRGGRNLS
jgi:hypothetical protein